jgi:hypothetical protein
MGIELDRAKLTSDQRDKLEQYQMTKKQLQALDDMVTMFSQLFNVLKDNGTNEEIQKLGTVLVDTREQLVELNKKESPELDNSPVVKAVDNLGKQLTKAIDKIDVKPVLTSNVAAPQVNVDAPDLSKLEQIVKVEIPKAFKSAVASIEIPTHSNSDVVSALEAVLEQLGSIDTGVRMKPQAPTTIKVTNPDGSNVGGVVGGFGVEDSLTTTDTIVGDIETFVTTNGVKTKTVTINSTTGTITTVWS